jgi:hypothetical protein
LAEELCNGNVVVAWPVLGASPLTPSAGDQLGLSARARNVFATAFLPEGFPSSVTPDYLGALSHIDARRVRDYSQPARCILTSTPCRLSVLGYCPRSVLLRARHAVGAGDTEGCRGGPEGRVWYIGNAQPASTRHWDLLDCNHAVAQAATPLGAIFQFFVRDMSGMLGGIVFAYFQVRGLDCRGWTTSLHVFLAREGMPTWPCGEAYQALTRVTATRPW